MSCLYINWRCSVEIRNLFEQEKKIYFFINLLLNEYITTSLWENFLNMWPLWWLQFYLMWWNLMCDKANVSHIINYGMIEHLAHNVWIFEVNFSSYIFYINARCHVVFIIIYSVHAVGNSHMFNTQKKFSKKSSY